MIRRLLAWRRARRERCRVTEEWQGYFIGRRHCRTHGYVWDPPVEQPCPGGGVGRPAQAFTHTEWEELSTQQKHTAKDREWDWEWGRWIA